MKTLLEIEYGAKGMTYSSLNDDVSVLEVLHPPTTKLSHADFLYLKSLVGKDLSRSEIDWIVRKVRREIM